MGLLLNNETVYSLLFADDQLLIAEDYEDIEYMARKLVEEYEKWGLNINLKKTNYMAIGTDSKDLILEEGKGIINHCEEYIYLGVKITNTGKHEEDINGRINKGRMAISKLNILWDRDITIKTKTNIYNTIVKSTITYGSETWHLKSGTIHKLHSTEMDFWRRSARISRREKIRNTVIREKMKVKGSLAEDIKTTQLRWFGHVKRMMEDRLPKKIYEWQPTGRRKRGRPNITWTEGILKTMRERGLQEGDWEDREEWRMAINS